MANQSTTSIHGVHATLTSFLLLAAAGCSSGGDTSQSMAGPGGGTNETPAEFRPAWADAAPNDIVTVEHDATLSDTENGAALAAALADLDPGDRLEIGTGTFSMSARLDISLRGTESAPIWITAAPGSTPTITRPDASQNVINVGSRGGAAYLSFEDLEIVGGSDGIKIYSCSHIRVDNCEVHDVGNVGIAANVGDCDNIYLTSNEVYDTGAGNGVGEGMYLGGNNGSVVLHDSVIAHNHVHDCGGSQGDGIELKQGSYGNRIAYNLVHDTISPCILAYGTGGLARNMIEGNICYGARGNVVQVQGDATVRNNLIIGGATGFSTRDHQGQVQELTVVHNTILSTGRGANLNDWAGRPGMVFANNVCYSRDDAAVRFGATPTGAELSGNVVVGDVQRASTGFSTGSGLSDFAGLSWDGTALDPTPLDDALLNGADPAHSVATDLFGNARSRATAAVGCLD